MPKSLKRKQVQTIIPPDTETPVDDGDELDKLARQKGRKINRLTTLNDIRKEMAQAYRAAHRNLIPWEEATKHIWVLRGMLATIEVEQRFLIPEVDPDERPVFTGLMISGPVVKLNGSQGPHDGKE